MRLLKTKFALGIYALTTIAVAIALAANVNISDLPSAASTAGADLFETQQGGTNKQTTGTKIATFINSLFSGDFTATSGGVATLKNTGPGATGPLGSATVSNIVTIDAQGRITALSSATIAPPESAVTFTDITTNNVSTTKHGFAPKAPNDATKYLDGTGAYTVPAGGVAAASRASYQANQWVTLVGGGIAAAGAAGTLNNEYCTTGYIETTVTVSTAAIDVTTLGGNVDIGLYSVSGNTATFIDSTGSIAAGTTGTKSAALLLGNRQLTQGLYLTCHNSDNSALVVESFSGNALTFVNAFGSSTLTNVISAAQVQGKLVASTFGTWAPTITLTTATDVTLKQVGLIGLKVVSSP